MKNLPKILGYVILIIGAISMILPFIYMLSLSFISDKQIISGSVNFIPTPFTPDNYAYVIKTSDIFKYFFNSMIVSLSTTIGQVIISAMAGYTFAR